MKEAQDTTKESIFVENIRTLTRFSYHPCCNCNNDVWKELQKIVSGFLASKKGWLLVAPGSDLIGGEERLAKDVFASVINLLVITDQCLIDKDKTIADTKKDLIDKDEALTDLSKICTQSQRECEDLKAELAQCKSAKKKTKK